MSYINKAFELIKPDKDCIYEKCINRSTLDQLQIVANNLGYNNNNTNEEDVLEFLTKKLDCKYKTYGCVLYKIKDDPKLNKFIDMDILLEQLKKIKVEGPHDSIEWFSNYNIDNTLEQVSDIVNNKSDDKFLHIYFHMIDYKTANKLSSKYKNINMINFADEYNRGIRRIGVVFNTDTYSGNGQHWFAVYCDLRTNPMTLEYFNSTGEEMYTEISELLSDISNQIRFSLKKKGEENVKIEKIKVTDIEHQTDNHSCGSYSLYYIISRLLEVPYSFFSNTPIPSDLMIKFREHLFVHNE